MAQTDPVVERGKQEKARQWFAGILASLIVRGFYGKVTLIFENGSIKRVVEERNLVPPEF